MKKLIVFILLFVAGCQEKPATEYVVKDSRYYLACIKAQARACNFHPKSMDKYVRTHIPKKYYVHIRKINGDMWEFACIDTTKSSNYEEYREALRARESGE